MPTRVRAHVGRTPTLVARIVNIGQVAAYLRSTTLLKNAV
jgi:hypothetical protein